MYRILDANFVTSVFDEESLAQFSLPEVAFAGRSNVGKSTLINTVCNRKSLAQTSKTPGRTQSLNYFDIRLERESDASRLQVHFVDLPGYGYAQVPKGMKKKWAALLENYLLTRRELVAVVLLVDSRREPQGEEIWFAKAIAPEQLIVALTKVDKLSKGEIEKSKSRVAKDFGLPLSSVIATSAQGKNKQGVERLLAEIGERVAQDWGGEAN